MTDRQGTGRVSSHEEITLRQGRMYVQAVAIPLVTHVCQVRRETNWIVRVAIAASQCQTFLHAWQRLTHETPSYHTLFGQGSAGPQAASYFQRASYAYGATYAPRAAELPRGDVEPGPTSPDGVDEAESDDTSAGTASQAPTSMGWQGVQITLVGNNELGNRRVMYLSSIRKLELLLDVFELDRAWVTLECPGEKPRDEIMYITDGIRS